MRLPNLELIIAQRELEVRDDNNILVRGLVSLLTYMSNSYKGESIDSETLRDACFNVDLYEEILRRYKLQHGSPYIVPVISGLTPKNIVFFPITDIRSVAVGMLRELDIPI